mmetsp:Transcript_102061/g.200172  ORF Transcript_102061/g.200172 Transcript_102061/m.200172 type:complete len:234 (+) Transcript_102061:3009-3710(+)
MAHFRTRLLTNRTVASPRDLTRLGNSSKARTRALTECVGVTMVDKIRKMCLSLAVCNRSRTGFLSPSLLVANSVKDATASSKSRAFAFSVKYSVDPTRTSRILARASIYSLIFCCSLERSRNRLPNQENAFSSKESTSSASPTARAVDVSFFAEVESSDPSNISSIACQTRDWSSPSSCQLAHSKTRLGIHSKRARSFSTASSKFSADSNVCSTISKGTSSPPAWTSFKRLAM